jgi:nucleoid DNA-binding protein
LYKIELVQSHIAAYLFQLNSISLPGLGTFSVIINSATSDFSGKVIKAPGMSTCFSTGINEDSAAAFLQYVAQKEGVGSQQAREQYQQWCSHVKEQLQMDKEVKFAGVGTMQQQADTIVFEQAKLPSAFFPDVAAERVVHPEAEHTMLVGDKETTNVVMTEYFAAPPEAKNRWWIWALLLALLGAGVVIFQLMSNGSGVFSTGNACKITPVTSGSLYRIAE